MPAPAFVFRGDPFQRVVMFGVVVSSIHASSLLENTVSRQLVRVGSEMQDVCRHRDGTTSADVCTYEVDVCQCLSCAYCLSIARWNLQPDIHSLRCKLKVHCIQTVTVAFAMWQYCTECDKRMCPSHMCTGGVAQRLNAFVWF